MKALYCELCDNGYDPDSALFIEDAIWEGGQFGCLIGIDAIREFFVGVAKGFEFAGHLVTKPQITITGSASAKAIWRLWEPNRFIENGKPSSRILLARYDDDLVLTRDGWKYAQAACELFRGHRQRLKDCQNWHEQAHHVQRTRQARRRFVGDDFPDVSDDARINSATCKRILSMVREHNSPNAIARS